MKKYIFGLLLALGVTSCDIVDVLDKKPAFEADLEGAITNPATVELALNGVYYNLPGNGFNVIFPTRRSGQHHLLFGTLLPNLVL